MPTYMLTNPIASWLRRRCAKGAATCVRASTRSSHRDCPSASASSACAKPIKLRCWPHWSSKAFAWTSGRRIMSSVAMPDWDRNVS